jgi:hypothetical protein
MGLSGEVVPTPKLELPELSQLIPGAVFRVVGEHGTRGIVVDTQPNAESGLVRCLVMSDQGFMVFSNLYGNTLVRRIDAKVVFSE